MNSLRKLCEALFLQLQINANSQLEILFSKQKILHPFLKYQTEILEGALDRKTLGKYLEKPSGVAFYHLESSFLVFAVGRVGGKAIKESRIEVDIC